MNTKDALYIFDFDKTLVSVEGLDVLASVSLMKHPHKAKLLAEISRITELGMDGAISFEESLSRRFFHIHPTEKDITAACSILQESISPSVLRNRQFFERHKERIYVVSGGFRELILPVTGIIGIDPIHVFANTLRRDKAAGIIGFDAENPLSRKGGKSWVIRALGGLNCIIIGDGYTDAEVKISGAADSFVAFTEHIRRERILQEADAEVGNFEELVRILT